MKTHEGLTMEGMVNHWLATPICYDIDAVLGNPESHLCSSLSTSVNSDVFFAEYLIISSCLSRWCACEMGNIRKEWREVFTDTSGHHLGWGVLEMELEKKTEQRQSWNREISLSSGSWGQHCINSACNEDCLKTNSPQQDNLLQTQRNIFLPLDYSRLFCLELTKCLLLW